MATSSWLLIGGDSLLGKEIRELVAEKKLPITLRLVSTSGEDRVLTEDGDELSIMEPLDASLLEDAEAVLLAGSEDSCRKAMALLHGVKRKPPLVDMTGHLEDLPEARLRAPILEVSPESQVALVHSVAQPAALSLARLLHALHPSLTIRHAVSTILEPASERGKEGVEELHQQTASLFTFKGMTTKIYDAQVSFNLLPRYGEEATQTLASAEHRIDRHLATLLGAHGVPLPSIRLIQAPVFHGYCQSVWVEFEVRPEQARIEETLRDAGIEVRHADVEPGSNASVAGQSGITVSDILEDNTNPRGVWFWMATDNLRTLAENALLTAGLLARGKETA